MTEESMRPLKVFLCHAHEDKPMVRELYKYLRVKGVNAWLDEEELLPGQDWDAEIMVALQEVDAIIICLSKTSVSREGYVHREIREALDKAKEKPSGTIFVIPAKLDDCQVPSYLKSWHWVELFSENGYERLMLSLKARAKAVGAIIKPTPVEEIIDEELENELKRLFVEGRGAFLVENWDKAINRFSKILSKKPHYPGVPEQLAEAERQKSFARLYTEGLEAYRTENWQVAIKVLEELLRKALDYKDAIKLLDAARKRQRLIDLYTEAQQLHAAGQWQAVIKVFEQINSVEPNYQDPDGLLSSAEKEVAEIKRVAELEELYSQSVRAIDAGQWYEARRLLEQVHKGQIGFLETEQLLRKVEDQIIKIEELQERKLQINTLYEQAHGLLRSKNWREVLGKIEEIKQLDPYFEDKDEIAKSARAALDLEEQEIQRQNILAAMYAQAVRLLREGKYQEALDKWQEVRTMDPKYPDRQFVQRTAFKKLAARGPHAGNLKQVGFMSLLAFTLLGIVWFSSRILGNPVIPSTSSTPSVIAATESPIPSPSATALTPYLWGFDTGSQSWGSTTHDITPLISKDGYLTFTVTGTDPYIVSPDSLYIDASIISVITVRMRVQQDRDAEGQIYFITNKDKNWNETKRVSFYISKSGIGTFQTYDIRMSRSSAWKDVITQFRLDPTSDQNFAQIAIDFVSVHAP